MDENLNLTLRQQLFDIEKSLKELRKTQEQLKRDTERGKKDEIEYEIENLKSIEGEKDFALIQEKEEELVMIKRAEKKLLSDEEVYRLQDLVKERKNILEELISLNRIEEKLLTNKQILRIQELEKKLREIIERVGLPIVHELHNENVILEVKCGCGKRLDKELMAELLDKGYDFPQCYQIMDIKRQCCKSKYISPTRMEGIGIMEDVLDKFMIGAEAPVVLVGTTYMLKYENQRKIVIRLKAR